MLAKTAVGERDLVDITTTAGTFIANGFFVHNCGPSWNDKLLPWLNDVGLTRSDLFITNTWDQGQPSSRIEAILEPEMRASMERLRHRIDALKGPDGKGPRVIVAAGNAALYALTGN